MTAQQAVGRHRIGEWDFVVTAGELRRHTDVRRLEPRAAKTLQLLCDANGEVVSQERLIGEVWSGRTLSENSVAVVIGQLRRALDDDAREPRLIETIPKRGYRLIAPGTADPGRRPRPIAVWLAALLMIAAIAAFAWYRQTGPSLAISVADVVNATGQPAFDPHARATSELIVADLAKRGFAVERGGTHGLRFESKLVMWNGAPSLGMTATDANGVVRWSAMTDGSPARVPAGVADKLDEFAAKFDHR